MPQPITEKMPDIYGTSEVYRKSTVVPEIEIDYDVNRISDYDDMTKIMSDIKSFAELDIQSRTDKDEKSNLIFKDEGINNRGDYYQALANKINKEARLPYKIAVFERDDEETDFGFVAEVDKSNPLIYVPSSYNHGELYYRNFKDGSREPLTKKEFETLKAQKKSGELLSDIPMYEIPPTPHNILRQKEAFENVKNHKIPPTPHNILRQKEAFEDVKNYKKILL